MSYTGVTINGTDTLRQWGLILLDDLKIGEAKLKSTWVNVPGTDGSLNLSYALTDGQPMFDMRTISFTLFASGMTWNGTKYTNGTAKDETAVNLIRTQLMGLYHGREVQLILPDDTTHHFLGVLAVGDKSKYNSGKIPITMTAYPYRLLNNETVVTNTIPSGGSLTVTLANEQKRVTPSFTVNGSTTIRKGTGSWAISSGTTIIPDLYLDAGSTTLTISGTSGKTVTIRYQEGRL